MKKIIIIKESPFGNQYGSLVLIEYDNGDKCLEMEDCCHSSYFGPLTDEHVCAFDVLCGVNEI